MAIVLGAKVGKYCLEALFNITIKSLYLWSDSRTALSWCSSYDKKEEFVSNRVRQIRETLPQAQLMYVQSELNPADILTRQPKAESLLNNRQWWNGPEFLVKPTFEWPLQDPKYDLLPEETMRKEFVERQSEMQVECDIIDAKARPDLIKASKADRSDLVMVASIQVSEQEGGEDCDSEYSFEGFSQSQGEKRLEISPQNQETASPSTLTDVPRAILGIDRKKWYTFHDILKTFALT